MSAVLRERYVSPLRSIYFCGSCGLCNSALVTHDGRGWGGMACTLLAHQSSTQTLASIESIPSCSNRLWKTLAARQNLTGPHVLNKKRTSTQDARKCRPARPQRVMARGVPSGARGATNKEHQVCARRRVVRRPGPR